MVNLFLYNISIILYFKRYYLIYLFNTYQDIIFHEMGGGVCDMYRWLGMYVMVMDERGRGRALPGAYAIAEDVAKRSISDDF